MQTLQDTAHFTEEQLQPDDTTLQSGFIMDISKGSLSMEAPGLGVCWGGGCVCGCVGGGGEARSRCCRQGGLGFVCACTHVCVMIKLYMQCNMTQCWHVMVQP